MDDIKFIKFSDTKIKKEDLENDFSDLLLRLEIEERPEKRMKRKHNESISDILSQYNYNKGLNRLEGFESHFSNFSIKDIHLTNKEKDEIIEELLKSRSLKKIKGSYGAKNPYAADIVRNVGTGLVGKYYSSKELSEFDRLAENDAIASQIAKHGGLGAAIGGVTGALIGGGIAAYNTEKLEPTILGAKTGMILLGGLGGVIGSIEGAKTGKEIAAMRRNENRKLLKKALEIKQTNFSNEKSVMDEVKDNAVPLAAGAGLGALAGYVADNYLQEDDRDKFGRKKKKNGWKTAATILGGAVTGAGLAYGGKKWLGGEKEPEAKEPAPEQAANKASKPSINVKDTKRFDYDYLNKVKETHGENSWQYKSALKNASPEAMRAINLQKGSPLIDNHTGSTEDIVRGNISKTVSDVDKENIRQAYLNVYGSPSYSQYDNNENIYESVGEKLRNNRTTEKMTPTDLAYTVLSKNRDSILPSYGLKYDNNRNVVRISDGAVIMSPEDYKSIMMRKNTPWYHSLFNLFDPFNIR